MIISFMFVVFTGCEEEESETTIQIRNEIQKMRTRPVELDGTLYDVVVYEFKRGDLIGHKNIGNIEPEGGNTGKIRMEEAEKVKIGFYFLPKEFQPEDMVEMYYTSGYFYIKKNKNKMIVIDGNTMLSNMLKNAKIESDVLLKNKIDYE